MKHKKRNVAKMPLEDDEINRLRLAALIDEYDSNESWIKDMRCNK